MQSGAPTCNTEPKSVTRLLGTRGAFLYSPDDLSTVNISCLKQLWTARSTVHCRQSMVRCMRQSIRMAQLRHLPQQKTSTFAPT